MAKAKIATPKDVELNRWCIEMAMRWPIVTVGGYGNAGGLGGIGGAGGYQRQECDADVIGRAGKIMAWVRQKHT